MKARISYRQAFAHAMRELRTERGYTQEQLALESGINRSHMSRLEHAWANPTLETLTTLCEFFDISLSEFARRIDAHARPRPRRS